MDRDVDPGILQVERLQPGSQVDQQARCIRAEARQAWD